MKRILLLLIVLFFTVPSLLFAQDYNIQVTVSLNDGGSNCGTISGLTKVSLLGNGDRELKVIHDIKKFRSASNHRLTPYSFSTTNPVKKVRFYYKRRYRNWIGDCKSRDSHRDITVNLPCRVTTYSKNQVYDGAVSSGSARIEVYPTYKLKYKDGSRVDGTKIVCETGSVGIQVINSAGTHVTGYPSQVYKWEFYDDINKVRTITDAYRNLLDQRDDAFQDYIDCENAIGGGGPGDPIIFRTISSSSDPPQKTTDDDLNARIPILGGGDPSPACKRWYDLYLQANDRVENFTGDKYYYRDTWKLISRVYGHNDVNLKLSDFYTNRDDQLVALNNKNILVRLSPTCTNTDYTSSSLTLQFLPEPPKVAQDPTFDSPNCSYDEVNNFKVYFNRDLLDGETINVQLYRFFGGTFNTWNSNDQITNLDRINDNLYSYTWRPNSGNKIIDGKYQIVVTGYRRNSSGILVQNCVALNFPKEIDPSRESYDITTPKPVVFHSASLEQDETCYRENDGQIRVKASGGSGSYKVYLNGTFKKAFSASSVGSIAETIVDGLSPNTYQVKILDSKNCQARDNSNREIVKNVTVNPKSQITHTISEVIQPSVNNASDASIKITGVNGGTKIGGNKYKYFILLNGNSSTTTAQIEVLANGFTITNLPSGTHKIRYIDANKCTQDYTLPEIINPTLVDFSLTKKDAECSGGNGQLVISGIKGGYEKYTVTLKRGSTTLKTLTNIVRTSTIRENLKKGTYTIIIKDSRSGGRTKSITIGEASAIVIKDIVISPIKCNGGNAEIKISATGGKIGTIYQYGIEESGIVKWQDDNSFEVKASTSGFRFKVRSKNLTSCESAFASSGRIDQPSELYVNPNPTVTHNNINGGAKGSISIAVSGGTKNYKITWKKDGADISKEGTTITELKAGKYIATITDANKCFITSKEIKVDEPEELKVYVSIQKEITCN